MISETLGVARWVIFSPPTTSTARRRPAATWAKPDVEGGRARRRRGLDPEGRDLGETRGGSRRWRRSCRRPGTPRGSSSPPRWRPARSIPASGQGGVGGFGHEVLQRLAAPPDPRHAGARHEHVLHGAILRKAAYHPVPFPPHFTWGPRDGPQAPTLRAPAKPWRFASVAVISQAPQAPTLRAPAKPWRFASVAVTSQPARLLRRGGGGGAATPSSRMSRSR